jgi:UDP-2,4-diacetamido-2,4,6-trideoxy-beta-L-altropyranose hydrolase
LTRAEQSADWLIVDHYGLDARYEFAVRPYVKGLLVIDDLADRPHRCDMLLDQNLYEDGDRRYERLVGPECSLLLGPRYALLRPPFAELRSEVSRSGQVKKVLLSFGGTDHTGETLKTLRALEALTRAGLLQLTVLTGRMNRHAARIFEWCRDISGARCIDHSDNIASLMLEADLAIGSGGSTTWERCCLGLPSLVITTANNQEKLTEHAARTGAIRYLGNSNKVGADQIREAVLLMMRSQEEMIWMSARAMELVDGHGADRTAKELIDFGQAVNDYGRLRS